MTEYPSAHIMSRLMHNMEFRGFTFAFGTAHSVCHPVYRTICSYDITTYLQLLWKVVVG